MLGIFYFLSKRILFNGMHLVILSEKDWPRNKSYLNPIESSQVLASAVFLEMNYYLFIITSLYVFYLQ